MEATRYREQAGSSSYTMSSTSGTVSTAGGSHLSWISMEAAMLLEEMGEEDTQGEGFLQPAKKFRKEVEVPQRGVSIQTEEIKSLAKEFFGASSAKWSIEGADMSVLEEWFEKLGVGWVLHLADGAAAGKLEQTLDVSSWIRALTDITDALRRTGSLFFGDGSVEGGGSATPIPSEQDIMTDQVQFASFTQQAILKLLTFVDLIQVLNLNNITCELSTVYLVAPYRKLYTMLRVHNAMYTRFSSIHDSSHPPPSAQVLKIQGNVTLLLAAKAGQAGKAIANTMEEIRNGILESVDDGDDSSSTQHPQGSPDIHKATTSVLSYIRFLSNNSIWVDNIVLSETATLGIFDSPMPEEPNRLRRLNVKMLYCVQEKLANKSEKYVDQSLRFIFLLNNLSFIGDTLHYGYFPKSYNAVHTSKVEGYIRSYIQVSWAPVLACLFNRPKPLHLFGKNYSTLLEFESKFHKIYTTQKLWKVPDPKLRKTLREAIIEQIVPGYKKYIEDNKVATPKFNPQDLEEMLRELFEG